MPTKLLATQIEQEMLNAIREETATTLTFSKLISAVSSIFKRHAGQMHLINISRNGKLVVFTAEGLPTLRVEVEIAP